MRVIIDLPKDFLLQENSSIVIRVKQDGAQEIVFNESETPQEGNNVEVTSACEVLFVEYILHLSESFLQMGKARLSETYACTARSFKKFLEGKDVPVASIDYHLMEDYEMFLKKEGLVLNTVSFYMRVLRAAYHKALKEYGLPDKKPFVNVFTGTVRTAKRATNLRTVHKIAKAEIKAESEALARDLFMFSFYTRGMSFVDIAFLKKSDIKRGYLIYKRQKTGQVLKVAWKQDMQEIVNRHPSLDGVHLLGILDERADTSLRHQYHIRQCLVNASLKRIAKHLKLKLNLTMYVARHSWATIAKQMNVPINVISDSMGHNSEKTTQIYLKSVDAEVIDRSNDLLIKAVERGKKGRAKFTPPPL